MDVKIISSLEKCFIDESVSDKVRLESASMLKNEKFNFQVCFKATEKSELRRAAVVTVESELASYISIYNVQHVPVKMAVVPGNFDENYLRTTAGLYPDLLTPMSSWRRVMLGETLESLWLEIKLDGSVKAGKYPVTVRFNAQADGALWAEQTAVIEVIDAALPEQSLTVTQWFYTDCLMNYYGTEAFDERHWQIIENYISRAVSGGINMILTPVFTPALDTYVGGERKTTQLVGIKRIASGDAYRYEFEFSKLERWIKLCKKLGVKKFEIAHFFTQWGAAHTPKIVAETEDGEKKIFGWETDALSDEYYEFLSQFIPALIAELKALGVDRDCVFHISDEPNLDNIEQYKKSRAVVEKLLEGYIIMDALSHFEFYESGAVTNPVPAIDKIEPFLENNVPDLWAYYCVSQSKEVSNRFISMPSYRNRIIGLQLYKFNIAGFLHWGYNFYNNRYSYDAINPLLCTDGENFAPGGDTFSVYPANDGTALASLRFEVFHDALQDHRALCLCEKLCGRETVQKLIGEEFDSLTFKHYPQNAEFILSFREKINNAIKNAL